MYTNRDARLQKFEGKLSVALWSRYSPLLQIHGNHDLILAHIKKYLILLFLILFILNVPVILTLMLSNNPLNTNSIFTTALFSLTFGNVGKSSPVCAKVESTTSQSKIYELMSFSCPNGMRMIDFVGINMRTTTVCNYVSFESLVFLTMT